jgi:hypothetical protein
MWFSLINSDFEANSMSLWKDEGVTLSLALLLYHLSCSPVHLNVEQHEPSENSKSLPEPGREWVQNLIM